MPNLGRLTTLLVMEGSTNEVRLLIWGGVRRAYSTTPHDPLVFPDGEEDRVNLIRAFWSAMAQRLCG